MCEDCRITDQFTSGDNPFQFGDRPVMRTTDDDLRQRGLERARAMANGKPPHEGGGCRTLLPSTQIVIAGLVPAIHAGNMLPASPERFGAAAEWALGTSPRVTAQGLA